MTEAELAAWRAHLVQWSAAQAAGSGIMLADETLAEQERQTRQAPPRTADTGAIAGRMFALVRLGQTPRKRQPQR
jgi:hypothetical protein